MFDSFIAYSTANLNPVTGTATNWSALSSPLAGITSIDEFECVGFAVRLTPTMAPNTASGFFQVGYFQNLDSDIGGVLQLPPIPQTTLSQSQFYQSGNAQTNYRSIRLNEPYGNLTKFGTAMPLEHGFYILFTGGPPSIPAFKLDVYYVYHALPTPNSYSTMAMDFARPGVRTTDFIAAAVQLCPAIQLLTTPDS